MCLVATIAVGAVRPASTQEAEISQGRVVRDLAFEGNRAIDNYTLLASIATSNSAWIARTPIIRSLGAGEKRYLDEDQFRRDVLRILLLYRLYGFPDAHVDTLVTRTEGAAWIRFLITEGRPIRVRSITISGIGGIVRLADLRRDLPLAVGDPFSRPRFQAATDTLRSALRERGYPFVEVFRAYEVNEDSLIADLVFDVAPGPRAVVDTIVVEGAQAVDDEDVTRMLAFRSGSAFRQSALYTSQRDLYRLGVFNYVNITLLDSVPQHPADSGVGVRVQVSSGRLIRLRAGAGWGTVDCFRVLAAWTVNNVFGGGRALDVSARASKIGAGEPLGAGLERNLCGSLGADSGTGRLKLNGNLTVSLREPYLWSRHMRGSASFSVERHSEVRAYMREGVGGNIAVTRETPWNVPITVSYGLSYGRTLADPAIFCTFLNICRVDSTAVDDTKPFRLGAWQSMISAGLVRDRTNSVLDPSRGSTFTTELRYASSAIGSDSLIQFLKGVVEFSSYHALSRRTTFAWRLRGGAIVSPTLEFTGQSVGYVPPAERFYGGGPTSVRGFAQNAMGRLVRVVDLTRGDSVATDTGTTFIPDTLTSPVGGNQLLIANAELRFPIPGLGGRSFTGALFVDAGQVFEREGELVNLATLRLTPGVGIRIASPLGPIRLDLAYNPHPPERGELYQRQGSQLVLLQRDFAPSGGGRLQLHFAVGQAF